MNVTTQARRDALEYVEAEMAFGEGAGTKRKLAKATVEGKKAKYGMDYRIAFEQAVMEQDRAAAARKAKRDRKVKDTTNTVVKTAKHISTGNHQNLNAYVFAAVALATVAHKTGFDKVVLDKTKQGIAKAKSWNNQRKRKNQILHLVKDA